MMHGVVLALSIVAVSVAMNKMRRLWSDREDKEVIRAALDIGSAEHKLVVGAVLPQRGRVVRMLYSESVRVALAEDLARRGGDGSLSASALEASSRALTRLVRLAALHKAVAIAGAATAVFRRASNGELHVTGAAKRLGLKQLTLVSQKLEGELGWLTALAAYRRSAPATRDIVSWDSGGGSFQLANRDSVFEGTLGNADVLETLRNISGFGGASPNPVTQADARRLVDILIDRLPEAPAWLHNDLAMKPLVAFGARTSLFRLAADLLGTPNVTREDAVRALDSLADRTDDELGEILAERANQVATIVAPHDLFVHQLPYPEVHLLVPKLALLIAVMSKVDIHALHYEFANGNCLGILLHPAFWKGP